MLCGYAVATGAVLCAVGARDDRVADLLGTAAGMAAVGCMLLAVVKYRNVRAGNALARSRPGLVGPQDVVTDLARVGYGGVVFVFALVLGAAIGLLVQSAAVPAPGRPLVVPIFCLVIALVCFSGGGLRWWGLARRPYLAEVRKVLQEAETLPADQR